MYEVQRVLLLPRIRITGYNWPACKSSFEYRINILSKALWSGSYLLRKILNERLEKSYTWWCVKFKVKTWNQSMLCFFGATTENMKQMRSQPMFCSCDNRSISQITEGTSSISHNAPFCSRMCTFSFLVVILTQSRLVIELNYSHTKKCTYPLRRTSFTDIAYVYTTGIHPLFAFIATQIYWHIIGMDFRRIQLLVDNNHMPQKKIHYFVLVKAIKNFV